LPTGGEEGAAWRRIAARQGRESSARAPRGRWFLGAGAVLAAAALFIAGRPRGKPAPTPRAVATAPSAPAPLASTQRPTIPHPLGEVGAVGHAGARAPAGLEVAAPPVRLALAPAPRPLPSGPVALGGDLGEAGEATVEIAPGTSARAAGDRALVRVVVDHGEVTLHVEKRVPGGPAFEVAAGPYRFRVLGTRFRVARRALDRGRGARVELWVDEGRVAVARGARALGFVEAGGHWSADRPSPQSAPSLEATPPSASAPKAPAPRSSARPRCEELAARIETAREALSCYLAEAQGSGLGAETALYEAARLRRDALRDEQGALETLRLYRARFPAGMLSAEVDLSIVELLPKLNRHQDALQEIGRLLAEDPGRERAAELHLMRGNIYREVLEDFGRAERDYAAVEAAQAPLVGDATFFRGVCLQALGRSAEARATLDRYLASGSSRFADEARRHLGRLPR
jgi:tetratricopeptide (TPR) repeat protein